ncbi:hypothetical protein MKX03_024687 [Papaver bracteatum]|nr:hypothetical protein MKX03_024687 [Papaver bracteatum]
MARIIKKSAASITPVLLAYTRTARTNYSTSSSIFITQLKNNNTNIIRSLIYRQDRPLNLQFFSSLAENNKGPSSSVCPEVKAGDLLHKVLPLLSKKEVMNTRIVFCIKYANAPDEENIYYRGLAYANLDKNLQKEFHRRLKILGIIPSTTRFLHEYMANRDMCSSDSANSPPTDQSTPESIETTIINDEGIPVHYVVGHPLVSADDIRNSGKNPKDFIWIPYPHTRSEKLLWIEVPSEGFFASESELQEDVELDLVVGREEDLLFLDGEDDNPYRCLPPKDMDRIMYPDLKHMEDVPDYEKAWENSRVALKAHHDEMDKIMYSNGRPPVVEMSDLELEHYQVWHM